MKIHKHKIWYTSYLSTTSTILEINLILSEPLTNNMDQFQKTGVGFKTERLHSKMVWLVQTALSHQARTSRTSFK